MDSDKAMDTQFGFHNGLDEPPTSACLGPNFMASKFYQLSPPEARLSQIQSIPFIIYIFFQLLTISIEISFPLNMMKEGADICWYGLGQDLTLALTFVRHVGFFNDGESIKAIALTKEKYGTVPRVYIVCGKDNIVKQDFQR